MKTLDTARVEAAVPGLRFVTMDGIVQAGGVGFTAAQARYHGSWLDFLYTDQQATITWSGPDRRGSTTVECNHQQAECDTDLMADLLSQLVGA